MSADYLRALPRFVFVGGTGVIVNQAMFAFMYLAAGSPLLLAGAVATETAIVNNYWWHEHWTFRGGAPGLRRFLRYNLVALTGLVVTLLALNVLVNQMNVGALIANAFAIGAGTGVNFVASRAWIWKTAAKVDGLTADGLPAPGIVYGSGGSRTKSIAIPQPPSRPGEHVERPKYRESARAHSATTANDAS